MIVTLTGDKISHADINLKLPKGGKDFYQNTTIREDAPWGLQQVQDAANHLRMASQVQKVLNSAVSHKRNTLSNVTISCLQELEGAVDAKGTMSGEAQRMNTADEVVSFVNRFMASILRSRTALVNPKKRTLDDLRNSRHAVRIFLAAYETNF